MEFKIGCYQVLSQVKYELATWFILLIGVYIEGEVIYDELSYLIYSLFRYTPWRLICSL